nr:immunoglobulin heavy chain junction region [Mus musculus]
CARSPTLLFW